MDLRFAEADDMMLGLSSVGFQYTGTPFRGQGRQYVGDRYGVTIQGATPNSQVLVRSTFSGNIMPARIAGQTDNNGNFSESGSFGSDTAGTWHQNWYVGDTPAGYFDLIVMPAPIGSPEFFAQMGAPVPQPILDNPTPLPAYAPPPPPTGPMQIPYSLVSPTPPPVSAPAPTTPAPVPTPTTGTTPLPVIAPPSDLIAGISNKYLLLGGVALIVLLALRR